MSDIDLKAPEALQQVHHLRSEDRASLDALQQELTMLSRRRCLILGSAPNARLPRRSAYEKCVCINGSPFVANQHGIHVDLTVMVGYTTSMKRGISQESVRRLTGLRTDRLLFVTGGDNPDNARRVLADADFQYRQFHSITPLERAAIIGEICDTELGLGPRDERVSNGVFAVILALWAGANEVIVGGISLTGGHAYAADTPRYHIAGDELALRQLAPLRKLSTTSADLHAATAIRLHRSQVGWRRLLSAVAR